MQEQEAVRWQEQRKAMQEDRQGKAELAQYQDEVRTFFQFVNPSPSRLIIPRHLVVLAGFPTFPLHPAVILLWC